MNKELEDRIYDAAISADFVTTFHKDYVDFASHSPCGEDISFEVYYEDDGTFDDIFNEVMENFKYFDVDEHAVFWWETHGKNEAPTDLQKLLNDAQYIKILYGNLCLHLNDLKQELEGK